MLLCPWFAAPCKKKFCNFVIATEILLLLKSNKKLFTSCSFLGVCGRRLAVKIYFIDLKMRFPFINNHISKQARQFEFRLTAHICIRDVRVHVEIFQKFLFLRLNNQFFLSNNTQEAYSEQNQNQSYTQKLWMGSLKG